MPSIITQTPSRDSESLLQAFQKSPDLFKTILKHRVNVVKVLIVDLFQFEGIPVAIRSFDEVSVPRQHLKTTILDQSIIIDSLPYHYFLKESLHFRSLFPRCGPATLRSGRGSLIECHIELDKPLLNCGPI
jgi:hypothetical protein